jgi:protein-L-isoaspartate(D-aspartate) O-methyltransferase
MVDRQLRARGIRDERVLAAMAKVARERFVSADQVGRAYEDRPLAIGYGQTISQPFVVARMVELAAPQAPTRIGRVLEIGAGSGYVVAVLAEVAREVFGVELLPELCARARANLAAAGVDGVALAVQDGIGGWPEHAPFDAIIVSAAAPAPPPALIAQLAEGGRLVMPVGTPAWQELCCVIKRGGVVETTEHGAVRFVAFVGAGAAEE